MSTARLSIYCDGGLGNRINALVSGLAVAAELNLTYCVHWPVNDYCAAAFEDVFKSEHPISQTSLRQLRGTLNGAIMMLHDQIASETLGTDFGSAYGYASIQEFADRVAKDKSKIFFYPALVPEWIPKLLIHEQFKKLQFHDQITSRVEEFVGQTIGKPFYGIHLRRTDLNVGLSDHEVLDLVASHQEKTFFVCSDDPVAEAVASAHPNVYRREKIASVERKDAGKEWLSAAEDMDGRTTYWNVLRSKESVIEGAIDMLILAHSEIIGSSGSTFQTIARTIGETSPVVPLSKPEKFNYLSVREIRRMIGANQMGVDSTIGACGLLSGQGRLEEAIEILHEAIERESDEKNKNALLYTLGVYYLNSKKPRMASILFDKLCQSDPTQRSYWLHLSYAQLSSGESERAKISYQWFSNLRPPNLPEYEANVSDFLGRSLAA